VPALRAIDARKPVVRIAAFQEPLDDALFEQPLQAPLGAQLGQVAIGALVERARAGLARAIHAALWCLSRCFRTGLAASGHDASNAGTLASVSSPPRLPTIARDRDICVSAARTKFVTYGFGKRCSTISAVRQLPSRCALQYFGQVATGRFRERAMTAPGRGCVKTPFATEFGCPRTIAESLIVVPDAFYEVEICLHSSMRAFSHSLGRKYAFVVMESCRSAQLRGQWLVTNLHRSPVLLRANGGNGRGAEPEPIIPNVSHVAKTGWSARKNFRTRSDGCRPDSVSGIGGPILTESLQSASARAGCRARC